MKDATTRPVSSKSEHLPEHLVSARVWQPRKDELDPVPRPRYGVGRSFAMTFLACYLARRTKRDLYERSRSLIARAAGCGQMRCLARLGQLRALSTPNVPDFRLKPSQQPRNQVTLTLQQPIGSLCREASIRR